MRKKKIKNIKSTSFVLDRFEVGLNQEDQNILQDWLSDWNLFVDELH